MKGVFIVNTVPLAILMFCCSSYEKCIHDDVIKSHSPVTTVLQDGTGIPDGHEEWEDSARDKREVAHNYNGNGTFLSLRIHVHYSLGDSVSAERKIMLVQVVDSAVRRISSMFTVIPVMNPLLLSRSCSVVFGEGVNKGKCARLKKGYLGEFCLDTFQIPDEHLGELHIFNATHPKPVRVAYKVGPGVNDTDLILYVIAKNTALCLAHHQTVMAYAAHCQVDETGRPVAGLANFCPLALMRSQFTEETFYQTVLHEILHVLGFSVSLFDKFRHCEGDVCKPWKNTVLPVHGIMRLVTDSVVRQTRTHFGCHTKTEFGGPLEVENSKVSSHWDSRMMHTSLMTASVDKTHSSALDPITLAIFQDSGWYQVDFTKADKFHWGKDAGCKFGMPETCVQDSRHFCTGNSSGCHFLHHDKAVCDAYRTGKCGLQLPTDQGSCQLSTNTSTDSFEIFSPTSRCFQSSVVSVTDILQIVQLETVGRCYEHKCSSDGTLHVRLGNTDWIPCTAGQTIQIFGLQGEIQCPFDIDVLCGSAASNQPSTSTLSTQDTSTISRHSTSSASPLFTTDTSNARASVLEKECLFVNVMLLGILLCWRFNTFSPDTPQQDINRA